MAEVALKINCFEEKTFYFFKIVTTLTESSQLSRKLCLRFAKNFTVGYTYLIMDYC